jgi:hypothetical protein
MTKFIKQTRASNKAKTRRKTKVKLLSWNKNWISVSASSPRLSSIPQGLLLAVYLTNFSMESPLGKEPHKANQCKFKEF